MFDFRTSPRQFSSSPKGNSANPTRKNCSFCCTRLYHVHNVVWKHLLFEVHFYRVSHGFLNRIRQSKVSFENIFKLVWLDISDLNYPWNLKLLTNVQLTGVRTRALSNNHLTKSTHAHYRCDMLWTWRTSLYTQIRRCETLYRSSNNNFLFSVSSCTYISETIFLVCDNLRGMANKIIPVTPYTCHWLDHCSEWREKNKESFRDKVSRERWSCLTRLHIPTDRLYWSRSMATINFHDYSIYIWRNALGF